MTNPLRGCGYNYDVSSVNNQHDDSILDVNKSKSRRSEISSGMDVFLQHIKNTHSITDAEGGDTDTIPLKPVTTYTPAPLETVGKEYLKKTQDDLFISFIYCLNYMLADVSGDSALGKRLSKLRGDVGIGLSNVRDFFSDGVPTTEATLTPLKRANNSFTFPKRVLQALEDLLLMVITFSVDRMYMLQDQMQCEMKIAKGISELRKGISEHSADLKFICQAVNLGFQVVVGTCNLFSNIKVVKSLSVNNLLKQKGTAYTDLKNSFNKLDDSFKNMADLFGGNAPESGATHSDTPLCQMYGELRSAMSEIDSAMGDGIRSVPNNQLISNKIGEIKVKINDNSSLLSDNNLKLDDFVKELDVFKEKANEVSLIVGNSYETVSQEDKRISQDNAVLRSKTLELTSSLIKNFGELVSSIGEWQVTKIYQSQLINEETEQKLMEANYSRSAQFLHDTLSKLNSQLSELAEILRNCAKLAG